MKKNTYLIIILSLISKNVQSQNFNYVPNYGNISKYSILDSATVKCIYKLSYLKDSINSNNISEDIQVLLIGNNVTKYYSQYALDYNTYITEYVKNHDNCPQNNKKGAWTFELFKNYPQGYQTVADFGSMLQNYYIYEEELPIFEWKVQNESDTILSYSCIKATTSFRGRDYMAWFTTDIPIPLGPWKFGGLPGLILKIYDINNNFIYECFEIEQLKNKEPIKIYNVDYIKINRKDLNKVYYRIHNNPKSYFSSIGIDFYSTNKDFKIPYNPIELE